MKKPYIALENMELDITALDRYRFAMEDLDASELRVGNWTLAINSDPRATFVLMETQLKNSVVEEDRWDVFKEEVIKGFAPQLVEEEMSNA